MTAEQQSQRRPALREREKRERGKQRGGGALLNPPSPPCVNHFTDGTTLNTKTPSWQHWAARGAKTKRRTPTGTIASTVCVSQHKSTLVAHIFFCFAFFWVIFFFFTIRATKCLPRGKQKKKKKANHTTLALRSQTFKRCFKDHSVLQSLSTDCRVLRSCCREVPVLLSIPQTSAIFMYRLQREVIPWSSPYKAGLAGKNPTSRALIFAFV